MNVSYSKSKAPFGVYVVLLMVLIPVTFLFCRSLSTYPVLTAVSIAANLLPAWMVIPVKVLEYYYLHKAIDVLNSIEGVAPKWGNLYDSKHNRDFAVVPLKDGMAVSVIPDRSTRSSAGRIGPVYTLEVGSHLAEVRFDLGRPRQWWETWIGARVTSARMLRAISKMYAPPARPLAPSLPPDPSE